MQSAHSNVSRAVRSSWDQVRPGGDGRTFSARSGIVLGLLLLALCALAAGAGCATQPRVQAVLDEPFRLQRDGFSFPNELVWEYVMEPGSKTMSTRRREPRTDYAQRCFVLVRAARQFFYHARFDPSQEPPDSATARRLVRKVLSRGERHPSLEQDRVVIPGFAGLNAFSRVHEPILKSECGGAWRSYVQRGHWRMIFPFSDRHQERTAAELLESLEQDRPPVVHVVRFPSLTINHAVLLFDAEEEETRIRFHAYDPNTPDQALILSYERASRTFYLPPLAYFVGGRVDAYEIYKGLCY